MDKKKFVRKYVYINHLSDTGIEFYGNKLENLFENAARGMFSIICNLKTIKPAEKRVIEISEKGICYEGLLVLWLERLLYIYEVDDMLFSMFKIIKILADNKNAFLEAKIYGEKIDLSRHDIKTAIKAPTYHELEVKRDNIKNIWQGRVIFDV
jgi:SHS2 domain-containing protein